MPTVPLPPPMPEPGTPDEAVVDRVLGGDVQAFELLMRRNNARLYRAIRSLVSDEEAVEELMQQSYVLAYTRLQQFARERVEPDRDPCVVQLLQLRVRCHHRSPMARPATRLPGHQPDRRHGQA